MLHVSREESKGRLVPQNQNDALGQYLKNGGIMLGRQKVKF